MLEGDQRRQKKYYDLRKRTTIYEVGDVVLKKNNAGVLRSSKKLNPVWKSIWEVNKIMSAVLLEKNVGNGEGEGELSSAAGEEIVAEIPGGDGGHSPEDEGSLADAESSSDTLAYEGGIGQKYVKKQKRKRKVPKWMDQYVWDSEE